MHYSQFSPHGVNADMWNKYHHLNCWILLMNPTILLTKSVDLTNGTGGTEAFQLLFQAKMREILSETHQETAFYLIIDSKPQDTWEYKPDIFPKVQQNINENQLKLICVALGGFLLMESWRHRRVTSAGPRFAHRTMVVLEGKESTRKGASIYPPPASSK